MGDAAAAGGDEGAFGRRKMDAMGEDGFVAEETVIFVDGGIMLVLREQIFNELDLAVVFGKVGLDWEVCFLC